MSRQDVLDRLTVKESRADEARRVADAFEAMCVKRKLAWRNAPLSDPVAVGIAYRDYCAAREQLRAARKHVATCNEALEDELLTRKARRKR